MYVICTSIHKSPLVPKDPGLPFVGRTRETFWDGFVDDRSMADELIIAAAPRVAVVVSSFWGSSSAKGEV